MITFCIMLFVISMLTALGITYFENKQEKNRFVHFFINNLVMLIFVFYLLFVSVRVLLGDTESTIIDSYNHSDIRTVMHYALPLVVVSLLLVACVAVITNKKHKLYCEFRESFNSILLFLLLLFNEFSLKLLINIETIYIYLLALFLIPIYNYIKNRREVHREDESDRLRNDAPIFIFIAFMEWVFVPCEIFFSNIDEMLVQYRYWEKTAFIAFLVTLVLYMAVVFAADEIVYLLVRILTFSYGIMLYVQYLFLNRKMKELTGVSQYWSTNSKYVNLMIWTVVVLAIVSLSLWKKDVMRKVIFAVSLIVLLTQCFTFVTLRITNKFDYSNVSDLSIEGMTELNDKKNVVLFVLDSFDGQTMDKFLDEDVEELKYFNDFVYYDNATSRYAFTALALPYILSGGVETSWREEGGLERGFAQKDFIKSIHDQGYDVRLYTGTSYIAEDVAEKYVDNYDTIEKEQFINYNKLYQLMKKMSKYSTSPFVTKNKYDYNTADFSFVAYNFGYDLSYDVPFYEYLRNNKITVEGEDNGSFRLYHFSGSHIPYLMNRNCEFESYLDVYDQTLGDMNVVGLYLDLMKRMDIYDQSLIIVMADHGQNYSMWADEHNRFLSTYADYNYTSSPLIMVKYPNASSDEIIINSNPVSQAELPQTIAEYIGLSNSFGRTFDDILPDEKRKRYYEFFDQLYEIDGNVKNESSWSPNVAVLRERK